MTAGILVIWPSLFEGLSQNVRERCADTLSIFAKHGTSDHIYSKSKCGKKSLKILK